MQAGSGWGSQGVSLQPSPLQCLQSCLGQGRPGCPQAAQTISVLPWGWTRLDLCPCIKQFCLPLPSAGRASTGEGKRRCQSRLCTYLWDEGCSAGAFQKFAVVEIKFD